MFNSCLLHNLPDNPSKDLEHAFEIMVFPNKESVSFGCISLSQKNEWVQELTHLIDKSLQDASKKAKLVSSASSTPVQLEVVSEGKAGNNVVPIRKKTVNGAPLLIRATKVCVV